MKGKVPRGRETERVVADQRESVDSDVVFTLFDTADVLEGDAR